MLFLLLLFVAAVIVAAVVAATVAAAFGCQHIDVASVTKNITTAC